MKLKASLAALAAVMTIAATLVWLTPSKLPESDAIPALPDDLDGWLAARESSLDFPLIPGTEKRIRWQQPGERTPYSIVYLHGFSASRREIAPTLELVADAIGANLFETRLKGHGRSAGALADVSAEDWLADAREALAVGAAIGERVILVGTSTGGTLAVALFRHPLMAAVSDVVLVSPNFAVHDGRSRLLTGPAGPQLAELMAGPTRSFETHSEEHATYWSSTYPTAALVEMMRLVDFANDSLPIEIDAGLLVLLSRADRVVSAEASIDAASKIGSPRKRLIEIEASEDPMNHVLAGEILSPGTTALVADHIVEFVRGDQLAPRASR